MLSKSIVINVFLISHFYLLSILYSYFMAIIMKFVLNPTGILSPYLSTGRNSDRDESYRLLGPVFDMKTSLWLECISKMEKYPLEVTFTALITFQ
jgi:hypothetical protein